MIHITPDKFITMPWKNGKGVTRQIISSTDHEDYDWRFSCADVSKDGPFSKFPGKLRILTVIHGAGMILVSNETCIEAAALVPVSFSGELSLDGRLTDGPVKNLNLIYSPRCLQARARVIKGLYNLKLTPTDSRFFGVYCLADKIRDKQGLTLKSGDFVIVNRQSVIFSLNRSGMLILYTLDVIV